MCKSFTNTGTTCGRLCFLSLKSEFFWFVHARLAFSVILSGSTHFTEQKTVNMLFTQTLFGYIFLLALEEKTVYPCLNSKSSTWLSPTQLLFMSLSNKLQCGCFRIRRDRLLNETILINDRLQLALYFLAFLYLLSPCGEANERVREREKLLKRLLLWVTRQPRRRERGGEGKDDGLCVYFSLVIPTFSRIKPLLPPPPYS